MTYEEALISCDMVCTECQQLKCNKCDKENCANEFKKKALEKQIPKKPINKTALDNTIALRYENCNIVVCPNCQGRLKLKSKGKYCDKCGQRLDWSE